MSAPTAPDTKYRLWAKVEAEMARHDGEMKAYKETSWHPVEDAPAPAPYSDMSRVVLIRQATSDRYGLHLTYRAVPEGITPK